MDRIRDMGNLAKRKVDLLKKVGVPKDTEIMRRAEGNSRIYELSWDMRRQGIPAETLQGIKEGVVEGGGSFLANVLDIVQRPIYGPVGAIEAGLRLAAPEGSPEGELLDSIYNRGRQAERVGIHLPQGGAGRMAQAVGMAHRVWEIITNDEERGTMAQILRNGAALKASGALDTVMIERMSRELFSGLGDLHGDKKGLKDLAMERGLEEGVSNSEMLEAKFGASSFENPFHNEITIPTSEGPKKIAHDGLFTRLFGGHIGFNEDGSGIFALEKGGILDWRTSDMDAFGAEVFLDPTTWLTGGSSGLIKAGGRPLTKKGIERLVMHEATVVAKRKAAQESLTRAGDEAALVILRKADEMMTPRQVAERLVIEEARHDPNLLARGGEIRFMGQKIAALGAKPGEQTRMAAALSAERRVSQAFGRFRRALINETATSAKHAGFLRDMLESIGSTGRTLTQFLRAEETANPDWLTAWARSEGGALHKMRALDNSLRSTGIKARTPEAEMMIDMVSDPMARAGGPLTEGQQLLMEASDEVDQVYGKLSQEAVIPAVRSKVADLIALSTRDHRFRYARRLQRRLSEAEVLHPDEDILPRTEVFLRNPDSHLEKYRRVISAQFPFTRVDDFAHEVASNAAQNVRRQTEQYTQPLYDELFDIWRLRKAPGLTKAQRRQAETLWSKRISALKSAEANRAEILLAKGDRGAFITPLNRADLKEMLEDIRKSSTTRLPKLHYVDDPVEHVRRRGQVAYQKEGQSYLIKTAREMAGDDLAARTQIESNLISVGSLENHPNASMARVGKAIDAYDEAVTPTVETGVRKEVVERVPLGKERMPVIDANLEKLTDEEINAKLFQSRTRLEATEGTTRNSGIRQQVKRARAEDENNAIKNEIIRREAARLNTQQKARELAKLDLDNPFDKAKALLVLRAAHESDTLRDLGMVLRGMERDPHFLAVDIQDQFQGLAKLAEEIKTQGRVAIDRNPAKQIQKWEQQVVYRDVMKPTGMPMTKALKELKTKEDMQLFFRSWLFGEDRFAKRWAPGTVGQRFYEAMNIFNDVPDWAEGSVGIKNFINEMGDEGQAMRQWLDEAQTMRQHLKKNDLDIRDLLPPASLRGEMAPDGTQFKPFGGIIHDRGRWRLTSDERGFPLYLPESIVRQLKRMSEEGIRHPEIGNVAKVFDSALNMIKFNLTVLGFPAFQVRNMISNNVFAFTSAGLSFLNPTDMARAGRLAWRGSDPKLALFQGGHKNSMRMLVMQDVAAGLPNNAPASLADIQSRVRQLYTRAPGRKPYARRANEIATNPTRLRKEAEAIKEQLDMEWFRDDYGKVYTQGDILREIPLQRVDVDPRMLSEFTGDTSMRELLNDPRRLETWRKNLRDKLLRSNAFFEQWTRQHLFMTHLRRGVGYEEAGRLANKWLLDYARLSPPEKSIFKRIFPFYTFYRKTVPLMVESIFTRPGATSLQAKMMREPQDPVVSFGTAAGERAVVQRDGNTYVVGNIDLPIRSLKFLDALKAFLPVSRRGKTAGDEGWKEIVLLAHPGLHTALGLATDYNVFQDRKLTRQKQDSLGMMFEAKFGNDHPMFKNGTITKTEGRDGKQHYYFDAKGISSVIQVTGLSRILNRADQMVRTVGELSDGDIMSATAFISGLRPDKMTGGEAELEKIFAVERALKAERKRRGKSRSMDIDFEIEPVGPNPALDFLRK
jgi:hypothetical protein